MMTAGKVVPQFVHQQNPEESNGERQAGEKRSRMTVQQAESLEESVQRRGLIMRVRGGEMRSGQKGSDQCEQKQARGEYQGTSRRVRRCGGGIRVPGGKCGPYGRLQISGSALLCFRC